jgi:flagellar motility protein MotE (MotC chaperone)
MASTDMEGSSSYSALERFLIWFLIPFVFTAVLLGVLLSIFDYDIKSNVQKALHGIPLIGSIVPAPLEEKVPVSETNKTINGEQAATKKEEEIAALNAKITELQDALQKSDIVAGQRDLALKEIQAKNTELEEKLKGQTQTEEEYAKKITELATLYGSMTPSKAAPIMESLTLKERVLVFGAMKAADRGEILEKMTPQNAAETSIAIKDLVPVKDQEIAALQERLALHAAAAATNSSVQVSKEDLGQTFANMTPKSAAALLLQMYPTSSDKVLAILSAMDNTARSGVMSSLADQSKETAALIATRLVQ